MHQHQQRLSESRDVLKILLDRGADPRPVAVEEGAYLALLLESTEQPASVRREIVAPVKNKREARVGGGQDVLQLFDHDGWLLTEVQQQVLLQRCRQLHQQLLVHRLPLGDLHGAVKVRDLLPVFTPADKRRRDAVLVHLEEVQQQRADLPHRSAAGVHEPLAATRHQRLLQVVRPRHQRLPKQAQTQTVADAHKAAADLAGWQPAAVARQGADGQEADKRAVEAGGRQRLLDERQREAQDGLQRRRQARNDGGAVDRRQQFVGQPSLRWVASYGGERGVWDHGPLQRDLHRVDHGAGPTLRVSQCAVVRQRRLKRHHCDASVFQAVEDACSVAGQSALGAGQRRPSVQLLQQRQRVSIDLQQPSGVLLVLVVAVAVVLLHNWASRHLPQRRLVQPGQMMVEA